MESGADPDLPGLEFGVVELCMTSKLNLRSHLDARRSDAARMDVGLSPGLHWHAVLLAPLRSPRYRCVLSGQGAQPVWPGKLWKKSPRSSQLRQPIAAVSLEKKPGAFGEQRERISPRETKSEAHTYLVSTQCRIRQNPLWRNTQLCMRRMRACHHSRFERALLPCTVYLGQPS